ncbi:MAG: formate dehydrogenase, partial [Oxalobacteraceae bacterium]
MSDAKDLPHATHPAGGWGSMRGMASVYGEAWSSPTAVKSLARMNKPKGVMCVSCAWPKPANYSAFEFCENGAKATLWELTNERCTPEFFDNAAHSVTALRSWKDHDLEKAGRLTHPMRYDAASDRYVAVSWEEAFAAIGATLRALPKESAVFYASGHAGLEASYLYALLARTYGNNNLPQSSNMCHETTSIGLAKVIGSPVGTIVWSDLAETDAFFFFGQNPGTNSPRFLHPMKDLKDRGGKIITFNPVIEQGLVSFLDPQNPIALLTGKETVISDQYHQLKAGGDVAAILGLCKHVVEADDAATAAGLPEVIDHAFIEQHTTGIDEFIASCR